jgi:hypothetical protein
LLTMQCTKASKQASKQAIQPFAARIACSHTTPHCYTMSDTTIEMPLVVYWHGLVSHSKAFQNKTTTVVCGSFIT